MLACATGRRGFQIAPLGLILRPFYEKPMPSRHTDKGADLWQTHREPRKSSQHLRRVQPSLP